MEKKLTKKEKIIACIGHVNTRSMAKMCNTSLSYVGNIISEYWDNEKI